MNDRTVGRRASDRAALSREETALAELFDGLRGLNHRYDRAIHAAAAAVIVAYLMMGVLAFLLYHSNLVAQHERTQARIALARGTRAVAHDSCVRQNQHRSVERAILRRSAAAVRRFAAERVLSPHDLASQLEELRFDIRALSDANCTKVADEIPLR